MFTIIYKNMENLANTTEVLDDLVKINKDRVLGYEKAIEELSAGNADLKVLFEDMIRESKRYIQALSLELNALDLMTDHDGTIGGNIYRAWMDVKATFSGNDRKTVLESCEFGEDAAQRAYASALEEPELPEGILELIKIQKQSLRLSHDQIKVLRNQQ